MGKRASLRAAGLTSRTPPTLLVVGEQPETELGLLLKRAPGTRIRFLEHLPEACTDAPADLAIGVFAAGDREGPRAFALWTHKAGLPALGVELGLNEALIGPLALPGRAGCGNCALRRMSAASAADPFTESPDAVEPANVAVVAGPLLVREIRAIFRRGPEVSHLLDHVLAFDAETRDTSLHRVIPLARCAVCGGAAAFPRLDHQALRLSPADSPEVVLGALAGWVDLRTGVISRVLIEPPSAAGVDLPIVATAAPPYTVDENGSLRRLPIGWGKGLTVSGALLSAVGEAIERYAASMPDPARVVWERPDELDGDFLDPQESPPYTDAQYKRDGFPYARFDPSVRHPWVLGKWLGSGDRVWVPAVFAFLSLKLRTEHLICQGTSNGLAASTNPDDAALRATLELVERDAFMSAWLTGRPGRRLEMSGLDPLLGRVLKGIEGLGATVEVYVLPTSACGTAIICLALGDGHRYPGATLGLGADLDPHSALQQAVLELGQTGPHLRRMMRSNALPVPADPTLVHEMLHHAAYYFPAERTRAFDRLRSTEAPIALPDLVADRPARSLGGCASALGAAGLRVALVDVTSPDVETGPFRVVRAISPDLQPISYGYGLDRRPVNRIRAQRLASEIPPIHPIW